LTLGSHVGTGFRPLIWTVPGTIKDGKAQSMYQICACKYTKNPPYCDATRKKILIDFFFFFFF